MYIILYYTFYVAVRFDTAGGFTNIKNTSTITGELVFGGTHRVEGGMFECDTLDECFFGGHTEHFKQYPFDEKICSDWHLYAVEACLRTKSNYVQGGKLRL